MSKEILIIVRDDLDGSKAVETIPFAYRGINYEIDLSESNVELFDKSIQQFLEVAREITPEPSMKAAKKTRGGTAKLPSDEHRKARVLQSRAIRAWARNNGFRIGDKGAIAEPILEAWQAAHPGIRIIPAQPKAGEVESVTAQEVQLALGDVSALMPTRDRKGEKATKAQREKIRAWAIENGLDQSSVGVVKKAVIAAYYEEHPEEEQEN